jgi:hypothetical protein
MGLAVADEGYNFRKDEVASSRPALPVWGHNRGHIAM